MRMKTIPPLICLLTLFVPATRAQDNGSGTQPLATLEQATAFSQRTGRPLFVMAGQET